MIPRYAGKRYEWRIGETTDDTEQTVAVTRSLLQEREAKHTAIGRELLLYKKSAHPGVSLWTFLQIGDPARVATDGDGCGAAMRAAPIGVLCPSSNLDDLVRGAYECAIPTHGGQAAFCAAAAVAGAVSAALDGRSADDVLTIALNTSARAESLRPTAEALNIKRCIERIHSDLANAKLLDVDDIAERYFPDCPVNIVPLAISLAMITQSANDTVLLAVNIGGDADSVASIGGAIAGALRPVTVSDTWFDAVRAVNGGELLGSVTSLAALRQTA